MSMSIETLLRQVPELVPSARRIAEEQDDEPFLGELLEALAALVTVELGRGFGDRPGPPAGDHAAALDRWFGAVEALAVDDDDEARFLVGSAFLDALGPYTRARAVPWLGRGTRTILTDLEAGWPEEEELRSDDEGEEEKEEGVGTGPSASEEAPGLTPGAWPDGPPPPPRCSGPGPGPPPGP